MTAHATNFDLRWRNVFDHMLDELTRVFPHAATVVTDLHPNILHDVLRPQLDEGTHHTEMLPLTLLPPVPVLLRPTDRIRLRSSVNVRFQRNPFFRRCNSKVNSETCASNSTIRASR